MERRELLAAWQNPFNPFDVDDNAGVEPSDVLIAINRINGGGTGPLPAPVPGAGPPPYYDVDGDDRLTAQDVLWVINAINGDNSPPVIVTGLARDTGPLGTNTTDGTTSDPEITGTVTDVTGVQTFQVSVDGQAPAAVSVDRSGRFTLDPGWPADGSADGVHTLRFTARDFRGNMTPVPLEFTFTLDTRPPAATQFVLDPAFDSLPAGDGQTLLATVALEGQADERVTALLQREGAIEASVASDAAGGFRFSGVALADGMNAFQVRVQDAAGNEGSRQTMVTFVTGTPATIGDPDVADGVRAALGLPAGHVVTTDDMQQITQLSLDTNRVQDLTGLEAAINLQSLELLPSDYGQPGALSDFTPLSGLAKLTSLALVGAGLDDAKLASLAAALTGVPGLESLDLRYNDLTGVTPLAGHATLATLNLYGNDPELDLSALKGMPVQIDLEPPDADRAGTVAELASALNYLPLDLFEHVLNRFEYQPYAGSMKGPQAVLETGAGNDWDQAGLLAALLAEAGIATRYVSGRIDVETAVLMDWLGVQVPGAAANVLASAGLNPVHFTSGNVSVYFRLDHAWLEAELNVPGAGTRWVALDPSWKFKDYRLGVSGLMAQVPFDEASYLSQRQEGLAYEYYQAQVAAWLEDNMPETSVADVAYDGPIIRQIVAAVPDGLPYEVFSSSTFTTVPLEQTHRVQATLKQGSTVLLDQLFVMPETSRRRITIGYESAPGGKRVPKLFVGGVEVAAGPEISSVSAVELEVRHFDAGDNVADGTYNFPRRAGQYLALGLDANQISPSLLAAQFDDVNAAAIAQKDGQPVDQDDQLGALLALAMYRYFDGTNTAEQTIADLGFARRVFAHVASGVATGEGTVTYHEGLQVPLLPSGFNVDIPNNFGLSVAVDGDESEQGARRHLELLDGSAQEHAVWEELAHTQSMSTIKSLQLAGERGIPVFDIDSSNAGTLVPQMTHPSSTKAFIQAYVDAGYAVTVPKDPTPLQDWQGVGFVAQGPANEAYIITGGLSSSGEITAIRGGAGTGDPDALPPVRTGNPDPNQHHESDPVNIANGNVTREGIDIVLPGVGVPLEFRRHYDSQSDVDLGLGPGWSFLYADRLLFHPDGSITWADAGGHRYDFVPNGTGGFDSPATLHGSFTAVAGGFSYRNKDGLTHDFDSAGKLTRIRDRHGNGVSINYDADSQISTVKDLIDVQRTLTLAWTAGHITSVTDFTGRSWTYGYAAGRLTRVTSPSDATTLPAVVQYDYYTGTTLGGLLRTVTQPDGGVTRYEYYASRKAYRVTDPAGYRGTFFFDLFRHTTSLVDERGNTSLYRYNDDGNLVNMIRPDGSSESYVWQDGLRRSWTDALGATVTDTYDALGNLVQTVDRTGAVTQFTYEPAFGQITSIVRPGGRVQQFTYDANGNLTRIEDALGNVTSMTYDARGRMLTQTQPNGNRTATPGDFTTTFTYNSAGQVLSRTTDLPSTETITYDARGNTLTRTDANGNTTTFAHDILGRQVQRTDALGHTRTFVYDPIGNLISSTDTLGRNIHFTYDQRQLLTGTVNPDGALRTTTYDGAGHALRRTDELGRVTSFGYDPRQRLIATLYPDGTSTHTTFDGGDRRIAEADRRGNVTRYAYDALGRLTQRTDAHGESTLYTYDQVGNLVTFVDRRGATTNYTYDLLDRVTQVRGAEGFLSTNDYDANGNLVAAVRYETTGLATIPADPRTLPEARKRSTQWVYDVADRPVGEIDPLGQSRFRVYDAGGRVIQLTDELGRTTAFAYDALDRETSVVDALGGMTLATYDSEGNVLSRTDERGTATEFAYDSRNRLVAIEDPLGGVIRYRYDAVGNTLAVTDERGRVSSFAYDPMDRRVVATNPLGGSKRYVYDANGNRTESSDELGRSTRYFYDSLDRMIQEIDPSGGITDLVHDPEGRATEVNDPLGHVTSYTYDLRGRRVQTQDAANGISTVAYDSLDNVVSMADELGRVTTFGYDKLDRLTQKVDPLGHAETYSYDAVGNLLATTDALGHAWQQTYDALDRPINVSDGNGNVTQQAFDAVGNRIRLTDANSNATLYTYDALNRLTRQTDPLGAATTFQYDASSNLVSTTDRNGRTTVFDYDGLDRRVRERWLDASRFVVHTVSSAYDAAGQLTNVADSHAAYAFSYDGMGRVLQSTHDQDPNVPVVSFAYTYDAAGNKRSRLDRLDGLAVSRDDYLYDALDRMTDVFQNVGGTVNKRVEITYDAAGQMMQTERFDSLAAAQPVLRTTYQHDAAGRMTQLTHARGATIWAAYDYVFDDADRLAQVTHNAEGTSLFSYDSDAQLTAANHASQTDEGYSYDATGNRTSPGYVTGPDNRLLADGAFTFEYDAEGNRIRRTHTGTGAVTQYAWDHRNRLVSVVEFNAAQTVTSTAAYTYDAFDRRIGKTVDADGAGPAAPQSEHYVYDGDHVALQFDGSGNLTHRYLYGPAVDWILADEDGAGDVLWALADHLGSVRDLADAAGQVVAHRVFDSFGNLTGQTGLSDVHHFGFTGRELDPETGLQYLRARYYDPAVGRFLSSDPVGTTAAEPNVYRYVGNNPVNSLDPSGLETAEQRAKKAELAKKMESPGWEGFKSYVGSAFAGSASDAGDLFVGAVNAALTMGEETLYMAHDSIVQPVEIGFTSKTWADYQPHSALGRWQEGLVNASKPGFGVQAWAETELIALAGVGQVFKGPFIDTPIEFVRALFCPDKQRLGAASFNLFAVLAGGRRGSFDPVVRGPGRGKPLPYAVLGGETGPEVGSLQTLWRPPSRSEPVPHKTVLLEGPDGTTWSGLHPGRGIFGRVRTGAEEAMGFTREGKLRPNVELGQRVGLNEAQFQRAQAYLERGNHPYTLFTHNCITFAQGAFRAAFPALSPVQHVGAMIGGGAGTIGHNP